MTLSVLVMAGIALITGGKCNACLPVFATGLEQTEAALRGLDKSATLHLVEDWKFTATMVFNIGGLLGTLLTIPAAKQLGRKPMFAIYFAVATFSIFITFGAPLPPQMRLYSYFLIGLSVFGVFGSFPYYLPELFPPRPPATE